MIRSVSELHYLDYSLPKYYNSYMKTEIIIHGHFYQPPREMPDTGLIPKQPSAFPHIDWNERINREGYAANAFSRYLTYDGRIQSIVNNYEYLSFNFGPTLLHWIKEHDMPTYNRIIQADAISAEHNDGHGNGLAQGYNHTILPLDTQSDARTQISWGIQDFQYHFKRKPEGIWLPEAAINEHVVDILIEEGITFIVLSPWQAEAIETEPFKWQELTDTSAPYDRPYLIEGTKGSLSVFFYNPELASGISFNHYLRDADLLYNRLLDIKEKDQPALLHSATDGEIFGHHEPFGDMCFAALVNKIEKQDHFHITNYGAYLAKHPATLRARLRGGESHKGSSWSCFHGVSRWYKDCGCSTGAQEGWDQKWRTPLRGAFTSLSIKMQEIYNTEATKLTESYAPDELLISYGSVLSGKESSEAFAKKILGSSAPAEKITDLLYLLEGQKFRMYMFTSCGWFFNDISGLEPIQNMRYAIQAARLYQKYTDTDLVGILYHHLKGARSNVPEIGDGSDILVSIHPTLSRGLEAVSFFVLNKLLALPEHHAETYGMFELSAIHQERSEIYITILDKPLFSLRSYHVSYIIDDEEGIILHIHDRQDIEEHPGYPIKAAELPARLINTVYSWIDDSLSRVADNDIKTITSDINNYASLVKNGAGEPDDAFFITNMGTCLRSLHSLFRNDTPFKDPGVYRLVENLLTFIIKKADEKIIKSTEQSLNDYLAKHATILNEGCDAKHCEFIINFLKSARSIGFNPDVTLLQNFVYDHIVRARNGEIEVTEHMIAIAIETGIVMDDLLLMIP